MRTVYPRWLAWDPTQAFPAPGNPSYRHHQDFEHFKKWIHTYGRGAYQPPRGNLDEEFDRFCEFALKLANCMIFVDEPAMIENIPQSFWDLHRLGHKRNLGLMIATHRLSDLDALAQNVDHLFVFRTPIIYDVWTLKSVLGPQGAQFAAAAQPYEYWYKGLSGEGPCPPIPASQIQRPAQPPAADPGAAAPIAR